MYTKLKEVLNRAVAQAESGKGKQRHARGETPFDRQPICEIGRMVGIGYNLGQAMKKAQEASRLPDPERMVAELLGAINYLASAVMLIEESSPAKVVVDLRDDKLVVTRDEVIGFEPWDKDHPICPTCHEKGGHHHSHCARNPRRMP